jgi:nucleoid-associated protein YgaU
MAVKSGHVRFASIDGDLAVEVMLDEQPPTMVGGYGGLQRVERRYDIPIIEWVGNDAYAMSIAVVFDGYRDRRPIDAEVNALEQMARAPGARREPPTITANGPLPRSRRVKWRIENLEFGDSLWSGRSRLRQQVTVTLVQHETDERLARLKRPKSKTRNYRVPKGGLSLQRIAQRQLGDDKRWKEIRELNPKKTRTPKKIPGGTVLRLPR